MGEYTIMRRTLLLVIFGLLSCYTAFSAKISAPATDTFHEGEYLGALWHMKAYYKGLANFPILVHGGMDYIPSLIAEQVFGDNAVIVGTRIILLILTAIMYFLFLDISNHLTKRENGSWFWTTVVVSIFYYFTPPLNSSVVDVAYFPVRDIFLFLTIWGFIRTVTTTNRLNAFLFLVVSSMSTAFSFFWCYNRGVMAVAFFTVVILGLCINRRRFGRFIFSTGTALSCLALLDISDFFGSIKENIFNISYWIVNETDINKGPATLKTLPGYLGFLMLCFLAFAAFYTLYRAKHKISRDNEDLFIVIASLVVVQLLLIKTNYHGGGSLYAFNSGWPSILVLFYLGSRLLSIRINTSIFALEYTYPSPHSETVRLNKAYKLSVAALAVFMVLASPSLFLYTRFLKKLILPTPDSQLVSGDVLAMREILADKNNGCYFNWTNDGVIALIAKSKYCTDYSYVHYASTNHEQNMLNQLKIASPQAIVYDSKTGSVELDQIHMSNRFPLVNQYILENYAGKIKVGTYLVVIKSP